MLPLPSSSRKYQGNSRSAYRSYPLPTSNSQLWTTLRTRTRLTNLAVFILTSTLVVSLLLNASYSLSSITADLNTRSRGRLKAYRSDWQGQGGGQGQGSDGITPPSIEATIDRDPRYGTLNHLIMVPGHALWVGHDPTRVEENEDWVLEPMQKGGSVRTFVKHIREGVRRASEDPKSLLVFSGGATRPPPSPSLAESQTYLLLARAMGIVPSHVQPGDSGPLSLGTRATTEEYALDSYENLLFSLARFYEVTGRWPARVTVVGYGMKRRRFEQLHRAAIRYPLDRFEYVGIDDEGDTTAHYAGELKYGFTPFLSSPSGCHPPLSTKRMLRNPYIRYHPYHTSVPDLIELMEWCPPISISVRPPTTGGGGGGGGQDTGAGDHDLDLDLGLGLGEGEVIDGFEVFGGVVPWSDAAGGGTVWDRERD